MDKYLKKFKVTHYGHCIIKEELIISDDEEDEYEDIKTEPSDKSFLDTNVEHSGSYETSKSQFKRKRSGRLRNENDNSRNDKQSSLDLFLKSKNLESSERFKNSKNTTNNEKPETTIKAVFTSDNIDELLINHASSHCHKCNVKRDVIRRKARCLECGTQLTYICESCNKTYRDFTDLGYHLKKQHTVNLLTHPCPVCNKTFAFRKVMLAHQQINHDKSLTGKQQCAKCGEKFESKHITEHEKVCDAEPPFKCDKCAFATTHRSILRKHVYNKHPDFKKECEKCNKTFANRNSMMTHLTVYCNKMKQFECHHCGHKFYRKEHMLRHLNRIHFKGNLTGNGLTRICKYCDTTLGRCEWMRTHLERCESAPSSTLCQIPPDDGYVKRARTCEYCGLTLKRYDHMKYHLERCESAPTDCRLESETADQPDLDTACKTLSKVYCCNCKDKKPLTQGVQCCKKCKISLTFTCERCLKSFRRLELLLDHLQVNHVKNKTIHRCDKCNRSFSRLNDLKIHKKTHHSSKPITKIYKCTNCGKNYGNLSSLRKHRISCSEEAKFHCDKCPYKTHYKSSLVMHLRTKRAHAHLIREGEHERMNLEIQSDCLLTK